MRIVFMGTPAESGPVLEAILGAGHRVVGVFTQPDKPAGRGQRLEPPPVKTLGLERGLAVFQPATLRRPEAVAQVAALAPEAIVVAAYGKLLTREVLAIPPLGCLNLHPSLLPRHRGPSPVSTAILEGDPITGVTVMLMDAGMDTGPILAQRQEAVRDQDTAGSLTVRLFALGAGLLLETLPRWAAGEVKPVPQDESRATVTRLLRKEDGGLDFNRPAGHLWRQVRACHPWPGAFTRWRGRLLKVLGAVRAAPLGKPPVGEAPVGTVVALDPSLGAPVGVVTAEGLLGLTHLHLEGKRPVPAQEFLRGYRDFVGSRLPD
jgi:methionyl-tRNA formyltransferase